MHLFVYDKDGGRVIVVTEGVPVDLSHARGLAQKYERQRSQCKECGGASICQHQRRRSQCKECGGASICPHQRRRSTCKECREEADKSMPAGLEEPEPEAQVSPKFKL